MYKLTEMIKIARESISFDKIVSDVSGKRAHLIT
jgi:hypothetical protein